MKHLFAIGLSLLMLVGFSVDAFGYSVWCATKYGVTKQSTESYCTSMHGKPFNSKEHAYDEFRRLKGKSTDKNPMKPWCATKDAVRIVSSQNRCRQLGGWPFHTQAEATAQRKRWIQHSSSGSTTTPTAPSTPPKKEKPQPKLEPKPSTSSTPRLAGTGTGFLVNLKYVVTADHVVDGCGSVTIRHSHVDYRTRVVARDSRSDLGLLRLEEPFSDTAKLRGGKAIRKGEAIATYGYPLFGELSDSAKITRGDINSLARLGNDSGVIQYDAPSQPGNSGGPVLDFSAHVVGVVSAGLSKKYADQSGHIAQNVNFAVKSYLVEGFLSSNNVFSRKQNQQRSWNFQTSQKKQKGLQF